MIVSRKTLTCPSLQTRIPVNSRGHVKFSNMQLDLHTGRIPEGYRKRNMITVRGSRNLTECVH